MSLFKKLRQAFYFRLLFNSLMFFDKEKTSLDKKRKVVIFALVLKFLQDFPSDTKEEEYFFNELSK